MVKEYFSKSFVLCVFVSILVIFSSLIYGSYEGYSVDMSTANQTLNEIEYKRENLTVYSIFLNNFYLTLITFIPFIGLLWMFFIMFNTGYIIGELAKAVGINNVLYISLLFTDIVGILEFTAYIFVLAESLCLAISLFKKEFKERIKNQTWKTLLLAFTLLFIGAIIECYLVRGSIIF